MPVCPKGGGEMALTEAVASFLRKTAKSFHGAERRRYMAEAVAAFGLSQRQAERELGWTHDTVRKALHELHSGITCVDNFSARGRKPCEFHLPHLLQDIRDLLTDNLQTDPTFQSTRLYCRLSAAEVREQLIDSKGYTEGQLPTVQTIGEKLNLLGFRLRSVTKTRPQKK
jgi:hypothetical protein